MKGPRTRMLCRRMLRALLAPAGLLLMMPAITTAAGADPFAGHWIALLGESRLPKGFPPVRSQSVSFRTLAGGAIECVTTRTTTGGSTTVGKFAARADGKRYAVNGSEAGDAVTLTRQSRRSMTAVFSRRGHPTYAYRLDVSADARVLRVATLNPISLTLLQSVIIYRRR